MHSPNLTEGNVAKLAELFPNCVTEVVDENHGIHGNDKKIKKAIDFDSLRQELSGAIVEGPRERYHLNWPGKREALLAANAPIAKTLRPCREESVDFDTTQNLFIEGDNLDALKLLQETYLGKVKMIYIDPPYNTGKDFIYKDNFAENTEEYLKKSNQKDEEGNRLVANTDSNGRFHSDWLSMMYPRLKLARNLLRDDGVVFISIDDNENHNLRKLCEEVFGQDNFLAELIWHLSSGPQTGHFTRSNESIIAYTKNKACLPYFKDTTGGTIKHGALKKISQANPAGEIRFKKGTIEFEGDNAEFDNELGGSEKQYITEGKLRFINGQLAEDVTIKAGWAMKNQVLSWLNRINTYDSKGQKVIRFYFNSQGILFYEKERGTYHPKTVISSTEVGGTKAGGDELIELFNKKLMSFPKPSNLIKFLCKTVVNENDIILDFFAGSATTAHAVMQLNAEDGGNRKFIMVQLPEKCDEKSEAYKAGYSTIAEIGKERIRRAGKKITAEYTENAEKKKDDLFDSSSVSSVVPKLDIGFRILKIDSSNMADVYYTPDAIDQPQIKLFTDNIKPDRTAEDLLFQVLLDWGVDMSLPVTKEIIAGKEVFFVDGNAIAACFVKDGGITEDFVKKLAKRKPLRVVFRDAGFKDDSVKINVEQIFKLMSPHTDVKCI